MVEEKKKYNDIVEYVESEVFYLKVERAGEVFEKLKEIKELFKRAHGSINLLESKIASSIVSIKSIYQTHTPAVELALTSFKKKLPLTEKELREYIEEKLRREKLAKLKEKLKEKEEQEKEEKEVTVVE